VIINQLKRFTLNISVESYKTKEDARMCLFSKGAQSIGRVKMAFRECSVTVDQFLNCATNGHTFCALFDYDPLQYYWFEDNLGKKHKSYPVYQKGVNWGAMKLCMKSDRFFKGSQVVFVDIDFTQYRSIPDYLDMLTFSPTCVYMSFSDKLDKGGLISRRFRLVYVFDKVLNREEFISVSRSITKQIEIDTGETMFDDCGTRLSQYMNGVYGNNEVYRSYCIYDYTDFPETQIQSEDTILSSPITNNEPSPFFDKQLLEDMGRCSYKDFMHKYSKRYQYKYRTELPCWYDGLYQFTNETYLQLWYYKEKVKDGEHRRRKLFRNACLRRLMFPEMDANTALFNLYIDFVRFFDNSDSVIKLDTLVRRVKKAFELSMEKIVEICNWEIQYWRQNRPSFILYPGVKPTRGIISKVKRKITYNAIDSWYDRALSPQENYQSNQSVSLSTLYRYVKDRGIDTHLNKNSPSIREERKQKQTSKQQKISLFKRHYNPSLSIRANQRNLVSYGLELSSSTIQRWKELYIDNPQLVQSPLELPKSGLWDSSFLPKFSSWGGYSLGSEM
jgi:hypothetical protein